MGNRQDINLKWMDGATKKYASKNVNLTISSLYNGFSYTIENAITIPELQLNGQVVNLAEIGKHQPKLEDVNFVEYSNASPKLLLGIPHTFLTRPIITIPIGDNYAAQETKLGWIVYGGNDSPDTPFVGHIEPI